MRLAISTVCVLASARGQPGTCNSTLTRAGRRTDRHSQEAQPTPAPACPTSSLLPSNKPTRHQVRLAHLGSPSGTWAWGHGLPGDVHVGRASSGQGS